MAHPDVNASAAAVLMRSLNPNAIVALEASCAVFVEDWMDSPADRRFYRLEYRCTLDGLHAVAQCLSNPWNRSDPSAGTSVHTSHIFADGTLCLGAEHTPTVATSPFDLQTAVARARYWCTGFSVLKETGEFPNL